MLEKLLKSNIFLCYRSQIDFAAKGLYGPKALLFESLSKEEYVHGSAVDIICLILADLVHCGLSVEVVFYMYMV